MASIQRRPNGKWRARYRDPEGHEHARHFDRKVDGQRWLDEQAAAVVTGRYVDPRDRTTVAAYARRWAASRPHKPGTALRTESIIRAHIEGTALGARRLGAVLPSELQGWVSDRATVLSPSTLKQVVGLVRSVYTAAVVDRLVAVSPAARLTLPSAHRERIVPLSVPQVRALAAATPARYRAMIITQAGLGLRVGELLGLRIDDIDFLRRTVRIEHQSVQRTRELLPPKTPRSKRILPLPAVVAEVLAEHLATYPASDPIGCDCPSTVTCSRNHSGLLFHTAGGQPVWHEHYSSRVFLGAAKRAGLPAGTTSHDLRHHYASVLLAAGESVIAVAERLGHDDASLVLSTYGHLMPDSESRTRKAIDAAWDSEVNLADSSRTGE